MRSSNDTVAAAIPGVGLDECQGSNGRYSGEREIAAEGFRKARKQRPDTIIAAWGGVAGDELFASLMRDGTFDLNMIEGYTYCPGCMNWPKTSGCCSTEGTEVVEAYFPKLEMARTHGYLNRTVFTLGYALGRSAINPNGWTPSMLRSALLRLKKAYPALAGVMMYGVPPRYGFPNATNMSNYETDSATFDLIRSANMIMREIYPDE